MLIQKEIFAVIHAKKVKGGKWDSRITYKELNGRGRIRKISYKPNTKQIVEICKGRKYHLVYVGGNLVHADVEDTKTGKKKILIKNGTIDPSLQNIYNCIKNSSISEVEKIMVLDAYLIRDSRF